MLDEKFQKDKIEKLLVIEKRISFKKGYKIGFLAGFASLISITLIASLVFLLFGEPLKEKLLNDVISGTMEQIFASFPDAYFTNNKDRIMNVLDDFTNATDAHRVSKESYKRLGRMIMRDLRDKKLTYKELNGLVDQLNKMAHEN